MKKLIPLLLSFTLVFSLLAGCGSAGTSDSGQAQDGGSSADGDQKVLYHAYASQPYITLDPRIENSNGVMVLHNVYETLTHYNDQTGEVEPLLATEWSSNDDGTEWTFKIREDVKFHDGTSMTAANVAASINKVKELGMGASYIWDAVTDIEAVGDYEVQFTCAYAASVDLIASAAYASYIVSDEALNQETEWFNQGNDGGTGPYSISQATGDTVVLQAYEDYRDGWQENQYKNVIIKEVPESSARRQLLETGEAQITSLLSSTDEAALKEMTDKVRVESFETYTNVLILLNHEKEPTSNADFRRALAYAFPYEDTIENVLEGNGAQSSGLVPSGLWGHSDDLMKYTTDLDKAKEYLDKSGVDTDGLSLILTYATGMDEYNNWAQLYQVNLKQLGIDLTLSPMEWDSQWNMGRATSPEDRQDLLVYMWWPDYASPESWFTNMVRSEENISFNLGYIKDEEYDALIDEAIQNTANNREKAEENYIEIQEKLVENSDFIFPYDKISTYVISNSIDGVYENPAYASCINYYNVTEK